MYSYVGNLIILTDNTQYIHTALFFATGAKAESSETAVCLDHVPENLACLVITIKWLPL